MAQLRMACLDGNLERVQELHGQGVSLTVATDRGNQPIHSASANGQLAVVEWLHGQGVHSARACTGLP